MTKDRWSRTNLVDIFLSCSRYHYSPTGRDDGVESMTSSPGPLLVLIRSCIGGLHYPCCDPALVHSCGMGRGGGNYGTVRR
jgi:hypothetical protein